MDITKIKRQIDFLRLFSICKEKGLVKRKIKMPSEYEKSSNTPNKTLIEKLANHLFEDIAVKIVKTKYYSENYTIIMKPEIITRANKIYNYIYNNRGDRRTCPPLLSDIFNVGIGINYGQMSFSCDFHRLGCATSLSTRHGLAFQFYSYTKDSIDEIIRAKKDFLDVLDRMEKLMTIEVVKPVSEKKNVSKAQEVFNRLLEEKRKKG